MEVKHNESTESRLECGRQMDASLVSMFDFMTQIKKEKLILSPSAGHF